MKPLVLICSLAFLIFSSSYSRGKVVLSDDDSLTDQDIENFVTGIFQGIIGERPYIEDLNITFNDDTRSTYVNATLSEIDVRIPSVFPDNGQADMTTLEFSVETIISNIDGSANYYLNVESPFVIAFGDDTMSMNVSNLNMKMKIKLNADESKNILSVDFLLDYDIENVKIQINNLMNDPKASAAINQFLNDAIPNIIFETKESVQQIVSDKFNEMYPVYFTTVSEFVTFVKFIV